MPCSLQHARPPPSGTQAQRTHTTPPRQNNSRGLPPRVMRPFSPLAPSRARTDPIPATNFATLLAITTAPPQTLSSHMRAKGQSPLPTLSEDAPTRTRASPPAVPSLCSFARVAFHRPFSSDPSPAPSPPSPPLPSVSAPFVRRPLVRGGVRAAAVGQLRRARLRKGGGSAEPATHPGLRGVKPCIARVDRHHQRIDAYGAPTASRRTSPPRRPGLLSPGARELPAPPVVKALSCQAGFWEVTWTLAEPAKPPCGWAHAGAAMHPTVVWRDGDRACRLCASAFLPMLALSESSIVACGCTEPGVAVLSRGVSSVGSPRGSRRRHALEGTRWKRGRPYPALRIGPDDRVWGTQMGRDRRAAQRLKQNEVARSRSCGRGRRAPVCPRGGAQAGKRGQPRPGHAPRVTVDLLRRRPGRSRRVPRDEKRGRLTGGYWPAPRARRGERAIERPRCEQTVRHGEAKDSRSIVFCTIFRTPGLGSEDASRRVVLRTKGGARTTSRLNATLTRDHTILPRVGRLDRDEQGQDSPGFEAVAFLRIYPTNSAVMEGRLDGSGEKGCSFGGAGDSRQLATMSSSVKNARCLPVRYMFSQSRVLGTRLIMCTSPN
ncbi:uncharacterized protein BXZ73DRAFT_78907 [Epithele typhae]|uniref:uncharacterized protein n=1 Tax=Epithele typhae TaxID=378194 RepID=UPI002007D64D|nr:uncharacterized protein BXZ73DRAFT_78907 [Epithele typhae]KAH9925931.1 hypothetical protein BXZ73DRAFT_78907 [Epithele typhae]